MEELVWDLELELAWAKAWNHPLLLHIGSKLSKLHSSTYT